MDSQVAKKRIGDVIRVDTITSSQADFLATHVEVKNIQLTKSYDGKVLKTLSEQEALTNYVYNPKDEHQLILVVGLSGTGKSHLIRWFSTKLERDHSENEVVLFIRRSDNSLKGTIKQLLALEEVAQIPNKDVYERLMRATAVIDNKKLKDMIYQNFIVEINNDENDEILTHHKKRRLIALLQNESFHERLLEDDKAIDRIYQKVAQGKGADNRDVIALFDASDFYVDAEFCEGLIRDEADRNARTMATSLVGDEELANQIASYMNTLVNNVIQTCAGLEPGDFEEVFKEIRKELKRQGKSLTLLIEDITAFTGVNVALLNVISLPNTGMYKDLCRISSIIGTTTAYFEDVFPANYRDRVTNYMRISDEAFGADNNSLYEFVGKYLNAMSLSSATLNAWVEYGGQMDQFPIHTDKEGIDWERIYLTKDKSLNLFPFTRTSIVKLFSLLPEHQQTPRYLLRDVVERVVRNYLASPNTFPSLTIDRLESYPWEMKNQIDHRARLMQYVSGTEFDRMDLFIRIWGNANLLSYTSEDGRKYIGGIPESAYSEFGMTKIEGLEGGIAPNQTDGKRGVSQGEISSTQSVQNDAISSINPGQPQKAEASPEQVAFQLGVQTVYKWIQGGSLNFDSTKKDAKMMQRARDEMNRYVYNAINWQIEGVSIDNISKFTSKDFIEFERQSKKVGRSLIMLPANQETQSVLEAFIAFVTLGDGKTWSFEGGAWRQYQVQLWFERIKPQIIEKVQSFNGIGVDYHKCAISAEMIREIVFGQYKGTTIEGMSESLLWDTNVKGVPSNTAHSKEWVSLMSSLHTNDQRVKDTILNYYNIVQGTGGKNKFLNHSILSSDFRKIKKSRLHIDESILSEKDPFKPRQDIRNIFRDLYVKLPRVSEAEKALACEKLAKLGEYIECTDIDDDDVMELVDEITNFYDTANKIPVNVTYDTAMINIVRKDAGPIANAISNVQKAVLLEDPLDILMAFSQDPLARVSKLLELLIKVSNDIIYVAKDIEKRKEKIVQNTDMGEDRYSEQSTIIGNDLGIVEGWEA